MYIYTWIPLNSHADLAQLASEISVEFDPKKVAQRLMDGLSTAVKSVLIERNYVVARFLDEDVNNQRFLQRRCLSNFSKLCSYYNAYERRIDEIVGGE